MPMTKARLIIITLAHIIQILLFVMYKYNKKNLDYCDLYTNLAFPLLAIILNIVSLFCFDIDIRRNGNEALFNINDNNIHNELNDNIVVINNRFENEIDNEQQDQGNNNGQPNVQQEEHNVQEQPNVQQEQ
jgi:hypothetical protein